MKLQCPVIRDGGSTYDLFGTEYHFAPQPDGFHVAEVLIPEHQDRFLEIGFRLYRGITGQIDAFDKPVKEPFKGDDQPVVDFSDLTKVDHLSLSDADLERFAAEVMGVSITRKSFINAWFQKHFSDKDPMDESMTIIEMIRFCAGLIIEAEKAGS